MAPSRHRVSAYVSPLLCLRGCALFFTVNVFEPEGKGAVRCPLALAAIAAVAFEDI